MLNSLARKCHQIAVSHGFWDHHMIEVSGGEGVIENKSMWPEKIALIHSEASEMLDALRDGNEDALGEECADLLIRLLDFTDARNIDLDYHVDRKMAKNIDRPRLHGREF